MSTSISTISPAPTAEEAAAIVAAVEALWPRPALTTNSSTQSDAHAWRFSGRWWASNHIARRGRPGR